MTKKLTPTQRIKAKLELRQYIAWMRGSAMVGLRKRLPVKELGYEECVKQIEEALEMMDSQLRADINARQKE